MRNGRDGDAAGRAGRPSGRRAATFCAVFATATFIALSIAASQGAADSLDGAILRSMRGADPPHAPIGSVWVQRAAVDVTSLGSGPVVALVLVIACSALLLVRAWRPCVLLAAATILGWLVAHGLKLLINRPRPLDAFHLTEVASPSFPSGHAMNAAILYLTLGGVLAAMTVRANLRRFIMVVAIGLTGIIGLTRIYLGVHFPTDVLAGWAAGLAWASLVWIVSVEFVRRRDARASH